MQVYPNSQVLPVGSRVTHIEHGDGVVSRKPHKSELPHTVWLKMDADGIEGTVDIRLLRWRRETVMASVLWRKRHKRLAETSFRS